MRFAADIRETDGNAYRVENSPQDVVVWEAKSPSNNVEQLKKLTSIMQILHIAAYRQKLTTHKGWPDFLANLDAFDLAEADTADPTQAAASDESSSPSLAALG